MKYIDEYRDAAKIETISKRIFDSTTRDWNIMEICGGQTHSIMKYNLESLLPKKINLIHGPGCPVCVTPIEMIDKAIEITEQKDVILTSFGDMLRVPGSNKDLLNIKAGGADVRIIYTPLETVKIAEQNPDKRIVFFAVGFETTAPANAMSVMIAKQKGLKNYSMLCSQVLVPPAIELLLSSPMCKVDGMLAAGHVCTVMGLSDYSKISEKYKIPIVITGFEPLDILLGISSVVRQLEESIYKVENQYSRAVNTNGNTTAKENMMEVFEVTDREWRGIGMIPNSGLKLKEKYSEYDAERIFTFNKAEVEESSKCIAGKILQGISKPPECYSFGIKCTPEHPLGAPMVSSEGACAAYYKYKLQSEVSQ